MDIEELKNRISVVSKRISEDKIYVREAEQKIAEYLCPFKVGDKVLSPKGKEEIIASISYDMWKPGYEFKVFKIRKDGRPYVNSSYAYIIKGYSAIGHERKNSA